jgi:signal peptidase II
VDSIAGEPTAVPRQRYGLIALAAAVVIALDQLSKWWAVAHLQAQTIAVVWTLQLNLEHNTGTAFSLGRGNELIRFLPLVVLVVVGVFVWQGRGRVRPVAAVAMGMIVGGALGNLTDRALRTGGGAFFSGGVVDFIDFQWWPVFNIADSAVVIGGILLVAVNLFLPAAPEPEAQEPDAIQAPMHGDPTVGTP